MAANAAEVAMLFEVHPLVIQSLIGRCVWIETVIDCHHTVGVVGWLMHQPVIQPLIRRCAWHGT